MSLSGLPPRPGGQVPNRTNQLRQGNLGCITVTQPFTPRTQLSGRMFVSNAENGPLGEENTSFSKVEGAETDAAPHSLSAKVTQEEDTLRLEVLVLGRQITIPPPP